MKNFCYASENYGAASTEKQHSVLTPVHQEVEIQVVKDNSVVREGLIESKFTNCIWGGWHREKLGFTGPY